MEKISWTNCVKNKALRRVKEGMDILYTIKGIGHVLGGNCHIIQGKIKVAGRQGGRRERQLDDLKLCPACLRRACTRFSRPFT